MFECGECGMGAKSNGDVKKHIYIYCHTCFPAMCARSSVTETETIHVYFRSDICNC